MSGQQSNATAAPCIDELARWEVTGYTTFVEARPTGRWVAYDDYQRMLAKVRAFVADQSAEIRESIVQGERQRRLLTNELVGLTSDLVRAGVLDECELDEAAKHAEHMAVADIVRLVRRMVRERPAGRAGGGA